MARRRHRRARLGCRLGSLGQGFAAELAAAAAEWAVALGHPGAVALIEPANVASRRVAEKAGLRPGEEVEHDGVPHLVYRIGD